MASGVRNGGTRAFDPSGCQGRDVGSPVCRACGTDAGQVVLDLGAQPASDYFPPQRDLGPDPVYPLQMWLCASCGLAQLVADPTLPEEPRGREPEALIEQAAEAVARIAESGWLSGKETVAEFGSPHGGSWLALLAGRGLRPVGEDERADIVVDSFGMMHAADQAGALSSRIARVAPGGALFLQYHSLETIGRCGQWNALRHGHFAYYSATALSAMLRSTGFSPRMAWRFDLYGGTVLLAATRDADVPGPPDRSVETVLLGEELAGVRDPAFLGSLERAAECSAAGLRSWLLSAREAGRRVVGYGAASRAVALLVRAGVNRDLLPAVADAAPAKHGLRMPGTDIPIIDPAEVLTFHPDAVLLFLPDLLGEVQRALPEVEASGAVWVDAEALGT